MIPDPIVARKMAALLLQIKAIKLNLRDPFTWSSGWKSPIYCDNRLSLSFPEIRTFIKEQLSAIIKEKFPDAELIAGVATAGIAHGALVADQLETPFCYVRSSAKAHGLGNRIEGLVLAGQKAIVVEDLISTGGSSLSVVTTLRESSVNVIGLVAIFSYGFDSAVKAFGEASCPYFTVTDYDSLLAEAVSQQVIMESDLEILRQWRSEPSAWGK